MTYIKLALTWFWVALILSLVMDLGFRKNVMHPELISFMANQDNSIKGNKWLMISMSMSMLSLIIGSIGMWNDRLWGVVVFSFGQLLMMLGGIFLGWWVASGIGGGLIIVYSIMAGSAICLFLVRKGIIYDI